MNDVFVFLDNKPYVLDGISGILRHEVSDAVYPYSHVVERLIHIPDDEGKKSKEYRQKRIKYRDDWVTDLTDNIDGYCKIAKELGIYEI